MESSSRIIADPPAGPVWAELDDGIAVGRWFVLYGAALLTSCAWLSLLISRQGWSWGDWLYATGATFAATTAAVKLVGLAVYTSMCTTLLPLPTGWIVAAVAARDSAVGAGLYSTVLLVAFTAAAGSTIANLNDYHLFTWLLRRKRIATVRETKAYRSAARWFARAPLLILVIFNIVPVPVDVVRLLATSYRYPRLPFAVANFFGRFVRYAVIALVTYWCNLGWIAVAALLAMALVLALVRLLPAGVRRISRLVG